MGASPDLPLNYGFALINGRAQTEYDAVKNAKPRTSPVTLLSIKMKSLNLGFFDA